MRLGVVLVLLLAACERTPNRELDLDLIKVHGAHLATDTVGEGKFVEQATFVLVDAENTGGEGAYITLAGELLDAGGAATGTLAPQSLWIPSHDSRTFALVDSEHKPRPATKTARVKVRGANMSSPAPLVRIEELHSFDDHGQPVVQAYLVNDANRIALVMVLAAFHDAGGRPIQRPFQLVKIGPQHEGEPGNCPDGDSKNVPNFSRCPIRFVGPAGAKTSTMFVGDIRYDAAHEPAEVRIVGDQIGEQLAKLGALVGTELRAGGQLDELIDCLARCQPARGDLGCEVVDERLARSGRLVDAWICGDVVGAVEPIGAVGAVGT